MTTHRDNQGRFQPGQSGNPGGRLTNQQLLERLVAKRTPKLLVRAFERAEYDDAVLAGLLQFLAVSLGHAAAEHLKTELAQRQAAAAVTH